MGAVTTVAAGRPVLASTAHPLQRCGAWAVAVLAGRTGPGDVTPDDLDAVAHRLVEDIVAVSCLPEKTPNPDWWKVLFALYPNAKSTVRAAANQQLGFCCAGSWRACRAETWAGIRYLDSLARADTRRRKDGPP